MIWAPEGAFLWEIMDPGYIEVTNVIFKKRNIKK